MSSLLIKIPKPKTSPVTIFAEGTLLCKTNKDKYYELEMDKSKCLVLFYKCNYSHRRLYVVCSPDLMNNKFIKSFEFVNQNLSIIVELRGRSFDRFKRSLDYLNQISDKKIMTLSPAFFWQLAYLCRNKLTDKFNLLRLCKDYNVGVKEDLWK